MFNELINHQNNGQLCRCYLLKRTRPLDPHRIRQTSRTANDLLPSCLWNFWDVDRRSGILGVTKRNSTNFAITTKLQTVVNHILSLAWCHVVNRLALQTDWMFVNIISIRLLFKSKQCHHHNGDQATRRPPYTYCARWAFTHLGLWRKLYLRLFKASFHSQPMYPKWCSIDIFISLQLVGWNVKATASSSGKNLTA